MTQQPLTTILFVDGSINGAQETADRHERLVKAAASAPRGQRVRLQQMARAACLERLRAELRGKA